MKQLIMITALMFVLVGCGPHFNRFAKPDTWVEPAPPVAVEAKPEDVVPSTPPSDTVTVTLPNWPGWAYTNSAVDAFLLLVIKDPSKFPIPNDFLFTGDGKDPVTMTLIPAPEKK